jgi:hypothetical protein
VKKVFSIFVILSLGTASCAEEKQPFEPVAPRDMPELTPELQPQMPADHPDLGSLSVLSRGPRRMSVDQIERSIEKIGELPAGTVVLDRSLALALGRPDYLQVTEESLEPSPLFMKFMMDLSGYICTALSDFDPMRPKEQRILARFDDPEENIRFIIFRFTGIEGAMADEYVARLRVVYDAGTGSARGARGGGEAVCMALFTSPEFLVY